MKLHFIFRFVNRLQSDTVIDLVPVIWSPRGVELARQSGPSGLTSRTGVLSPRHPRMGVLSPRDTGRAC
ncbi:hypothetical protein J6590_104020 [Homalodisca vitripennis]|nr:hypothetical protein J6590_104020 [Homalodisca vitripennis]